MCKCENSLSEVNRYELSLTLKTRIVQAYRKVNKRKITIGKNMNSWSSLCECFVDFDRN